MSDVTIALSQGPSWPGNRDKVNETLSRTFKTTHRGLEIKGSES